MCYCNYLCKYVFKSEHAVYVCLCLPSPSLLNLIFNHTLQTDYFRLYNYCKKLQKKYIFSILNFYFLEWSFKFLTHLTVRHWELHRLSATFPLKIGSVCVVVGWLTLPGTLLKYNSRYSVIAELFDLLEFSSNSRQLLQKMKGSRYLTITYSRNVKIIGTE